MSREPLSNKEKGLGAIARPLTPSNRQDGMLILCAERCMHPWCCGVYLLRMVITRGVWRDADNRWWLGGWDGIANGRIAGIESEFECIARGPSLCHPWAGMHHPSVSGQDRAG